MRKKGITKLISMFMILLLVSMLFQGTVSAVSQVTVDGNAAEWSDEDVIATGSGAISSISAAEVNGNLYVLIKGTGITSTSSYNIYIDSDFNETTGFKPSWIWKSSGADYLITGGGINRYRLTANGTDWAWDYTGAATVAANTGVIEASVSLAQIGLSSVGNVKISCTVDNENLPATGKHMAKLFYSYPTNDLTEKTSLGQALTPYMICYGPMDQAAINKAKTYKTVIIDSRQTLLTRAQIQEIQKGVNVNDPSDDVKVIAYISVGEDLRTTTLTDAQIAADPRFKGDQTGPRVDPRGVGASGGSLNNIAALGNASPGGSGYASYYLDDNDRNGIPDRNYYFKGAFVNAGDPAWFEVLQNMSIDGPDGISGLKEILTTTYGRGLGCDGVFMDTLDTACPNAYTSDSDLNKSRFEWTAPGVRTFVKTLKETYPDKLVVQNRGIFFFDPRAPQYSFSTRPYIDFVMFESYRLNSNSTEYYNQNYFNDNKFNMAPKLMAEANRADGFHVLSLGYAEGPDGVGIKNTLMGNDNNYLQMLQDDITETQDIMGFHHYITDGLLTLVNDFVKNHSTVNDTTVPVWSSSYNDNNTTWPVTQGPTPRVGIQEAVAEGRGAVTVRWDVALDMNRVKYALYYKTTPFDFTADPNLTSATRIVLNPGIGDGYRTGIGPGIYANQSTITGLTPGQQYYFVIRASDVSANANEEKNTVYLTATPLGTSLNWSTVNPIATASGQAAASLKVTSDANYYYFRIDGNNLGSKYNLLLNTDNDPNTGYLDPIWGNDGCDYLIENGRLFSHVGNDSTWSWTDLGTGSVVEVLKNSTTCELKVAKSAFTNLNNTITVGYNDVNDSWMVVDRLPASGDLPSYPASVAATITIDGDASDWSSVSAVATASNQSTASLKAYNDANYLYFCIQGTLGDYYDLLLNSDNNFNTGYLDPAYTYSGADYLIENGRLFSHIGDNSNWSGAWTDLGTADITVSKNGSVCEIRIARTALAGLNSTHITLGYKDIDSSWALKSCLPLTSGGSLAGYDLR